MWQKRAAHHWGLTKSIIGSKYRQLGGWAKEMDQVAGVGRRMFSLAAPFLQDLGHGDLVDQGMQYVQNYDNIRHQAMNIHDNVTGHARRINDAEIF
jgi:hypothetical protein